MDSADVNHLTDTGAFAGWLLSNGTVKVGNQTRHIIGNSDDELTVYPYWMTIPTGGVSTYQVWKGGPTNITIIAGHGENAGATVVALEPDAIRVDISGGIGSLGGGDFVSAHLWRPSLSHYTLHSMRDPVEVDFCLSDVTQGTTVRATKTCVSGGPNEKVFGHAIAVEGVSIRASGGGAQAVTNGTITATPVINGVNSALSAKLTTDVGRTQTDIQMQAPQNEVFLSFPNRVGCEITASAGMTPDGAPDVTCSVIIIPR